MIGKTISEKEFNNELDQIIKSMPKWERNDYLPEYIILYRQSLIEYRINRRKRFNLFSVSYRKGEKKLRKEELYNEDLDNFSSIRKKYSKQFREELENKTSPETVKKYSCLLKEWVKKRNSSKNITLLKNDLYSFISKKGTERFCKLKYPENEKSNIILSEHEIETILNLQKKYLDLIERMELSDNLGYFFRGINIPQSNSCFGIKSEDCFMEYDVLSSYSYSCCIAEIFSAIKRSDNKTKRIIIARNCPSLEYGIFANCLVNKELPINQFELLVLPPFKTWPMNYKGVLDDISHYAVQQNKEEYIGNNYEYLEKGLNFR